MSFSSQTIRPHKRDGFWCLVRRVPLRYAQLDKRGIVRISTRIRIGDDPRGVVAQREVGKLNLELERYWRDLAAGINPEGIKKSQRAVETANKFGLPYMELGSLEMGPLAELVKRLLVVEPLKEGVRDKILPGVFGHHPKPVDGTLLSEMVGIYEVIHGATLMKKSPEQLGKWRKQRERALKAFIKVIGGDRRMVDLREDDVDTAREFWKKRVVTGEVDVDTANKYIGRVGAMFREINDERRMKLPDIFHRKRIKGGTKKKRVAFDAKFVQEVLLADGVMDGLSDEARAIFYVVAETGMRPSEVAGLRRNDIVLDHEVPHVRLVEEGRALKNENSVRDMPLVGVALEVMKHFPDGFPNYRDRVASLTTTIGKYMRENGLCPMKGQSFYSLRHTFKDRLRGVDQDKELRDFLMGHSGDVEDYGNGHLLKRKQEVLLKMAFRAPRLCFVEVAGPGARGRLSGLARRQPRAGGRWSRKERHVEQEAGLRPSGLVQAAQVESDGDVQ